MNNIDKITPPEFANAVLILQDGSVFWGMGIGKFGTYIGEICFNTSMSGYQEIITDPSYKNQIITFTFPHIGNVGVNNIDIESNTIHASAIVINNMPTSASNWRAQDNLDNWLKKNNKAAIIGIDTRALTKHLRENGSQNALIHFVEDKSSFDLSELIAKLNVAQSMENMELAKIVTCNKIYQWCEAGWNNKLDRYEKNSTDDNSAHIVVIDFGVKKNILREIAKLGAKTTVVPCTSSAKEIIALAPDGILLSNGPGDPSETAKYVSPVIKELLEQDMPIFGICLGHQILSITLGLKTKKILFGHRGANHPVKNKLTGKVEITSQNHGFCVVTENQEETSSNCDKQINEFMVSLFDGSNEGIYRDTDRNIFSVQHHPEASPGPHDSNYLFNQFFERVKCHKQQKKIA